MKILGVKVDQVKMTEALETVEGWLSKPGKHYITTPNLEFIRDAQKDQEFKEILSKSDLSVPDSSRLGWLKTLSEEESHLKRILIFPAGIAPKLFGVTQFDVVTGVDLMKQLCKLSADKGFTVGLLGAAPGVAEQTAKCLIKKYPNLKISFAAEEWNSGKSIDLLFVAFGHIKQEKWIAGNIDKIPVKVAMGVGGAFDYLSGNVPRAPKWARKIGMEWLYRLLIQPWRIRRQLSLVQFLIKYTL